MSEAISRNPDHAEFVARISDCFALQATSREGRMLTAGVAGICTDYSKALDTDDPAKLRKTLAALGGAGLLGSAIDGQISRYWIDLHERLLCLELVGRTSNELAFLCQQHLGATALINGEHRVLKTSHMLRRYSDGSRTLGIAASHLRGQASRNTGVCALPEAGGLRFKGNAAWVSGFGILDDVLIGARTPDGEAVFIILPFQESNVLSVLNIGQLWAMNGTSTVSIAVDCLVEQKNMFPPIAAAALRQLILEAYISLSVTTWLCSTEQPILCRE